MPCLTPYIIEETTTHLRTVLLNIIALGLLRENKVNNKSYCKKNCKGNKKPFLSIYLLFYNSILYN